MSEQYIVQGPELNGFAGLWAIWDEGNSTAIRKRNPDGSEAVQYTDDAVVVGIETEQRARRIAALLNDGVAAQRELTRLQSLVAEQAAEIERLRKTTDRLHKTADEVVVTKDDRVWVWDEDELCDIAAGFACLRDGCMDGNPDNPCYSTREAALTPQPRTTEQEKQQ